MYFRRISFAGFRNLMDASVELAPGVNLFVGENGQGKTNLLEALFVLSTLKSFREAKRAQLTRQGESEMQLSAAFETAGLDKEAGLTWRAEGRALKLNGHRVEDLAAYFQALRTVCFSPEDLELLSGAPNFRRRFLDRLVFQARPAHALLMQHYQRTLKQRNALLRRLALGTADHGEEIEVWDEKLLELAAQVTHARLSFLAQLNALLPTTYPRVSALAEEAGILAGEPQLSWHSPFSEESDQVPTVGEALGAYRDRLRRHGKEERRRGATLWGPHLEDFVPSYGAQNAAAFASMGQRKTFLLAVRLAELELVRQAFGQWPALLLDDLSAELDAKRLKALVDALAHLSGSSGEAVQTIVTSVPGATDVFRELGEARTFRLVDGRII